MTKLVEYIQNHEHKRQLFPPELFLDYIQHIDHRLAFNPTGDLTTPPTRPPPRIEAVRAVRLTIDYSAGRAATKVQAAFRGLEARHSVSASTRDRPSTPSSPLSPQRPGPTSGNAASSSRTSNEKPAEQLRSTEAAAKRQTAAALGRGASKRMDTTTGIVSEQVPPGARDVSCSKIASRPEVVNRC